MKKFKVAMLQLSANEESQNHNLKKGEKFIRLAHNMGADLVLFPEMWNIAYEPYYEAVYNPHLKLNKDYIQKLHDQSIEYDSPLISQYRTLCKELSIGIGITFLEKVNDQVRNVILIIDRTGQDVLHYTKVHNLGLPFDQTLTMGEAFPVGLLETEIGPIYLGAMIGHDKSHPESARILTLNGAEIILIPNASTMDVNQRSLLRTRSFENQVGVALCNYAGRKMGNSLAYSGVAYNVQYEAIDMEIIRGSESEGIFIATFDLDRLRDYRKNQKWKNHRKPAFYHDLIKE